MPYKNRRSSYNNFILIFVFIKIALNMLAMSHFGFHRDEFLHLTLSDHLDWGYKEVPPFIAVLAKITTFVFGTSVFAARIFSTVAAGLIVWLVGAITVELGGKMFAITLACLSIIFAPAFMASDYLFQPVVFDQLWWVLAVWLIIKYINHQAIKYLYFLGMVVGIGLLTKYTMAFFTVSLILGLLLTRQRKLLWNRHVLGAALVAVVIFLPNAIWQLTHHLPVITHMKTLQESQLNYIKPSSFIMQQVSVNGIALFLWLIGFGFLLFSFKLRKFQFLAFTYILIFIFLLEMSGKNYYIFGAYPMLFAAGGYAFERWINIKHTILRALIVILFTLPNLPLLPMMLPVFPLNTTQAMLKYAGEHTRTFRSMLTWEDQKVHALTQDYADMLGWDELTEKVAKAYYNLTPEQRRFTIIYADNYGEAGAIHYLGKKYNLPDVVSLNSSFALWAPNNLTPHYIIYVDENNGDKIKKFAPITDSCTKQGWVTNQLAREKNTAVLLLVNPKPMLNTIYKQELAKKRLE